MKKYLIISVVAILSSNAAYAADDVNPWTQCGIGSMIFNSDGDGSTIGAAISNIIWDLGTTAVMSNGSSQNNCTGIKRNVAEFIDKTYPQLEQETAQAQGENIVALLDIYQCEHAAQPQIAQSIRTNFAKTVSQPGYEAMSHQAKSFAYYQNVNQIIGTQFSAQCSSI